MATFHDYIGKSSFMPEYKNELVLPDLSYSSDFQFYSKKVALPQSLMQQNFRRARSCDNILDDTNSGSKVENQSGRSEEVIGFHFGRPFHLNNSSIDKEGYNLY